MEPKVHYHVCKNPPLVLILSQMHSVSTFPPYFTEIHSNVIFPFMPKPSQWSLPFGYSNQILYAACFSHPILLHLITLITSGDAYKLQNSSLYSCLQPLTTPSLLGPNIFLSMLFSNTLNLCSSLSVRDKVSHPHKTTGKIIVLYQINYIFFYI